MKSAAARNLHSAVTARLHGHAASGLSKLGYTPQAARELQRECVEWTYARYQALSNQRGLLRGWAVRLASDGGHAELVPVEVPRAGRGQITVRVHVSAVSPGTERAQYLRLPNTQVGLRGRAGYSCSGVVAAVGPGVTHVEIGDVVAVTGAPHASVVTVDAGAAYLVPRGVSLQAAALLMLGVICGQGVTRARLSEGERFGLVGAGAIGILSQRLAVAAGAQCAVVVATSRRRQEIATVGGGRFLVTDVDGDEIGALRLPVVIEATGSPIAIDVALSAAGERARVILIGSPRGVTTQFPLDEVRARRARIVGAHVNTLMVETQRGGVDAHRREATRFLEALANSRLTVADLVGPSIDPREAGLFYRRLATDPAMIGAHFDWTHLPCDERLARGRLWRMPDVRARGVDLERAPLPPGGGRGRPPKLLQLRDPFEDARGQLRVGLLGCGDIALDNAAAAAVAPNVTLVACFDPAAHLARDLACRFGVDAESSPAALMERSDIDAVFLSVPHHVHAPLAIQAVEAGCHVIVEKPMANELTAASDMVAAAERAGRVLTVCFPHRYAPNARLARRLVRSGVLGEFGGALVKHLLDKTASYWIGGYSGRSVSNWRSSRALSGGGVLIMNLSHYIDLLRHICGVEGESITGLTAALEPVGDVEDAVSFSLRFTNGAIGSMIGSAAVRATAASEVRMWGRDGHVTVEPNPRFYTMRAVDGLRAGRWQNFGRLPRVNTRAVFLSRFATAICEGREPDVTARDGIAVQAIMEAAYRAAESGGTVRPADLVRDAGSREPTA